ncbi:hypothetical protein [Paenibacillus oleatilyticus]|uniref:Uncharacterized protein n=1 Tax=Paenibacillus oleatilyticus TaxID=2594886 RepID=A0ABV4VCC1_9BACL
MLKAYWAEKPFAVYVVCGVAAALAGHPTSSNPQCAAMYLIKWPRSTKY